jgi:hypothetical protein
MTRLSPHAKASLDALAEKHLAFTIAKATIEAELKAQFEERISSYRQDRDMALRLADEAGVPRTQLGKAIGTTNYKTVQEILEVTEHMAHTESDAHGKWSIVRLPNGLYNLSVFELGAGSVSGSAEVELTDDDIVFVSGDEFVIPQIYRAGYFEQVLASR